MTDMKLSVLRTAGSDCAVMFVTNEREMVNLIDALELATDSLTKAGAVREMVILGMLRRELAKQSGLVRVGMEET